MNYHLPVRSYSFLVGNVEFISVYTVAAVVLRRVVKIDWRLRTMRDVMWLLLVATCAACVVAFVGTRFLEADHLIPAQGYLLATMNWWVGDAVAIGSIVPFSLIYVVPGLRRYMGYSERSGKAGEAAHRVGRHELQGFGRAVESGLFAAGIVAVLVGGAERKVLSRERDVLPAFSAADSGGSAARITRRDSGDSGAGYGNHPSAAIVSAKL